MIKFIFSVMVVFILFFTSCSVVNPEENNARVVQQGDKIYIVDRTDKKWDVTHAVNEYNFRAGAFQFGLGPFAIVPINSPKMVSPGESGYPSSSNATQIIGTTLSNDVRAYPLDVLSRHEMVNEIIGDKYVGVGY